MSGARLASHDAVDAAMPPFSDKLRRATYQKVAIVALVSLQYGTISPGSFSVPQYGIGRRAHGVK